MNTNKMTQKTIEALQSAQAAAAEAEAATMAGIMEGTTGKKGKGDALCAANRRLSRQ